jgi:stress response protein YsnF
MAKAPEGVGEDLALPIVEEVLRLGRRRVATGGVRVSLSTEVDEKTVRETLRSDRVEVDRVEIGRELAAGEPAPTVRHEEDGTLVVPVLEEVLAIERRLVLREEIRLRAVAAEETVEQAVTLRRQHAEVERLPAAQTVAESGLEGASGDGGPAHRTDAEQKIDLKEHSS